MTLDEKVLLSGGADITRIAKGKWLMKIKNKRGRTMLPSGTQCVTLTKVELVPFMRTYCF